MVQAISSFWQYLVPQHLISRLVGSLAHCKSIWLKNAFIHYFIKRYGVDMRLAEEPNPLNYPTFNAFFTRALQPAVRPITMELNSIACPVDGCVSQLGAIENGRLFQAKGFYFNLNDLLGGSDDRARPFSKGFFTTFYLAPKDYHRIHMPVAGKLIEMVYIPGQLFSVNKKSAAEIPNLFARNERVVATFETESGYMAMVLVGAMIVASIETTWAGLIAPGKTYSMQTWRYLGQDISLAKGAEMGRFQLGSTVIVLFSSEKIRWEPGLVAEKTVIMGQKIATY